MVNVMGNSVPRLNRGGHGRRGNSGVRGVLRLNHGFSRIGKCLAQTHSLSYK